MEETTREKVAAARPPARPPPRVGGGWVARVVGQGGWGFGQEDTALCLRPAVRAWVGEGDQRRVFSYCSWGRSAVMDKRGGGGGGAGFWTRGCALFHILAAGM